mgnify:CR=1 FL=1
MKIVVLAGGISTERDVSLCSGRNIYEALKGNGHDVVLVDFFMPVMDGVEFVRELRSFNATIKCIMISQVSAKELISKAYTATGLLLLVPLRRMPRISPM